MAHTSAHLNAESFWWWQCNEWVLDIRFVTPQLPRPYYFNGFCGRKAKCFLHLFRGRLTLAGIKEAAGNR